MEIQSPYIEIQLYFSDIKDTLAYAKIVYYLLENNHTCFENAVVKSGNSLENEVVFDTNTIRKLTDVSNVHKIIVERNIHRTYFLDILNTKSGSKEWLTYGILSKEAKSNDNRPVAIVADGGMFLPIQYMNNDEVKRSHETGLQVYKMFMALTKTLNPDYGAIVLETPMECPYDLAQKSVTRAFFDFFLNSNTFKKEKTDRVRGIFKGAYFETTHNGIYISTNASFNPKHITWKRTNEEGLSASSKIGKLIAQLFL